MNGGTYCRFKIGGVGKSSAHMMYISREKAVEDREQGSLTHNLPEDVTEAEDYAELRTNLASYAWAREESERARHKSVGEVRTHYRCTVSFEKEVETEKAKEMVNEWLEERFPNARACAFIHRDTEHTHSHIWIDARQMDGRKIDLSNREYRSLDESWNRIYSREMGRDCQEHLDKKQETREQKASMRRGEERQQPERVHKSKREMYREREERNAGMRENHDQERDGRGQSNIASRVEQTEDGERAARDRERGFARAEYGGAGQDKENRAGDGAIDQSQREIDRYISERQRGYSEVERAVQSNGYGKGENERTNGPAQKDEPSTQRRAEESQRSVAEPSERTAREQKSTGGEQEIGRYSQISEQSNQQIERTESGGRGALRETEGLRGEIEEFRERDKEIEIDRGMGFER